MQLSPRLPLSARRGAGRPYNVGHSRPVTVSGPAATVARAADRHVRGAAPFTEPGYGDSDTSDTGVTRPAERCWRTVAAPPLATPQDYMCVGN